MVYYIVRNLIKVFLLLFNRWEVRGEENIPATGPVVLVANHVSYWDPPVVGSAVSRKVHFMAKEELFRVPLLKLLLPHLECFPVKRGKADMGALRTALKYLSGNEVIGIFPEGTRSKNGELQEFEQGAGLIAVKGGATVIPIALFGTRKAFPASLRGHIRVQIGEPLRYQDLQGKKLNGEDLERVNAEIAGKIKMLLAEHKDKE